jgi:lactoylglutathione lyase
MTESNVHQAVPFFAVSDIQSSVRYYVEGLGFEMTSRWVVEGKLRWCWLRNGNAALMLQEFRKEGHDSWVPEGKLGEGVTIYFICEDALAIYRELRSRGIRASRPAVYQRVVNSGAQSLACTNSGYSTISRQLETNECTVNVMLTGVGLDDESGGIRVTSPNGPYTWWAGYYSCSWGRSDRPSFMNPPSLTTII